jgi:hypothetical protein
MQAVPATPSSFALRFREIEPLVEVQRRFESSSDFATWTEVVTILKIG